jgi:hypothetical protein
LAPSPLRITTSNFIFQLNTCLHSPYVTSSVTRGWVCCLELLLALVSAFILGSESRGTHDLFYSLGFEIPPTLRARSPYLYPPGTGWPSYPPPPQALGSLFVASYNSQGYGVGIRTSLHTGFVLQSHSYFRLGFTANQFVLATSPLRLTTSIFFSTEYLPS